MQPASEHPALRPELQQVRGRTPRAPPAPRAAGAPPCPGPGCSGAPAPPHAARPAARRSLHPPGSALSWARRERRAAAPPGLVQAAPLPPRSGPPVRPPLTRSGSRTAGGWSRSSRLPPSCVSPAHLARPGHAGKLEDRGRGSGGLPAAPAACARRTPTLAHAHAALGHARAQARRLKFLGQNLGGVLLEPATSQAIAKIRPLLGEDFRGARSTWAVLSLPELPPASPLASFLAKTSPAWFLRAWEAARSHRLIF